MRDVYYEQLERLADRLLDMSRMVGEAMDRATMAMSGADLELAGLVVAGNARVEQTRVDAEDHAYALLAARSPAATDPRVAVAAIQAATSLERMGRLAVHVAEAVQRRYPQPVVPSPLMPRFTEMGRIAVWLATMAGQVIVRRDATLARALVSVDDEMDDLHRTLFTVIDYREWTYGAATAVDVTLLSRFYERFADHAVSLAWHSTFLVPRQSPTKDPLPLTTPLQTANTPC
ncbi:MAG: phoU [Amycolatopsis sp.]|uniref:phosphate signaling complex PhoU family protein n=1 Tax=Amycolatopsis sp. TaxID=37632 RepID=UPI00260237DF|nr:PhoU domain-containing protein [Amycolatopsis sp.]MCU1686383.1 phoU [Amycolatopsis sp.]